MGKEEERRRDRKRKENVIKHHWRVLEHQLIPLKWIIEGTEFSIYSYFLLWTVFQDNQIALTNEEKLFYTEELINTEKNDTIRKS